MKERSIKIILMTLIMFFCAGLVWAEDTFIIGVAPHTSARVILEMYQPLRLHLEKELGMRVDIVTAPDFNKFAERGLANAYDLAITTSHQARLFQTDAHYIPLVTYKVDFRSMALVAAKSSIRKPGDLKQKKVLGLSPTSQVTLWGKHWLADNGVGPITQYVSASDSMAHMISTSEAAAGFMSLANYQKLAPSMQQQLRILDQSKSMPGRVYVLNSRRSKQQKKIDAALWSFAETPAAHQYFMANKLDGYRKLQPKELNAMDKYAAEVRQVLRAGKE